MVVQEAFDTIISFVVSVCMINAVNNVLSASVAGAEINTRLTPFFKCAAALSRWVKIPVHSKAMSTFDQGKSAGSRSALTCIDVPFICRESLSTVTA